MEPLSELVDRMATETAFSGVVSISRANGVEFESAYGLADRRHSLPNRVDTQFGTASATKGFTALTVASLIEEGRLQFDTTARSVLGNDLPLIRDDVTIKQLLAHRSGIGDYFDEEVVSQVTDYGLPVPVHRLVDTEDFLAVLDGFETAFAPDERFAYCNGGFVVLALIAERASGVAFHELVRSRVFERAGMVETEFLRSDELPGRAAIGYLSEDSPRTNVLHLPVRGSGDGGVYSTVADLRRFWPALFGDRIVGADLVAALVEPRSDVPREEKRYGLGFWLHRSSDVVLLEGYDAGVSFRSGHDPTSGTTWTVISNTSNGAWDLVATLDDLLGP